MPRPPDRLSRLAAERRLFELGARGPLSVCLVYPNTYAVGMANLGFQAVLRILNDHPQVTVERAFLPDGPRPGWPRTAAHVRERPAARRLRRPRVLDLVRDRLPARARHPRARRAAAAHARRAGRPRRSCWRAAPRSFSTPSRSPSSSISSSSARRRRCFRSSSRRAAAGAPGRAGVARAHRGRRRRVSTGSVPPALRRRRRARRVRLRWAVRPARGATLPRPARRVARRRRRS